MIIIEIDNVQNYGQIYRAVEFFYRLCSIIKSKKKRHGYTRKIVFFWVFSFFSLFLVYVYLAAGCNETYAKNGGNSCRRASFDAVAKFCIIKLEYTYMKRGVLTEKLLLRETAKQTNLVIIIFTAIMIMDTAMLMYT